MKRQRYNERHQHQTEQIVVALNKHWQLGKNIVLAWSYIKGGLAFLMVPYYYPANMIDRQQPPSVSVFNDSLDLDAEPLEKLFYSLISGSRQLDPAALKTLAGRLDVNPVNIPISQWSDEDRPDPVVIDTVARRYSISLITDRAVILFDIDRFSLSNALEQTVMINSLGYSINSAYKKILSKNIRVDFARYSTGDGFYVWNRQSGLQANIDLYHLMHIVLADNAIARRKTNKTCVPSIKTAFHVGNCFEFYQTAGLDQTRYSYIVGDATIELARLIEKARPGQILVGDFLTKMAGTANAQAKPGTDIDSIVFIEAIQHTLDNLRGVELSGHKIEDIKCYLTGQKQSDDSFDINMLRLVDKHNRRHFAYNAKINIYPEHHNPIYLGIQEAELTSSGQGL